ncbi:hypothetical protein AU476_31100 [Cupriavidus sp. UYMSc13B]|nr:hypothetical protein AU476_31100 [Cupriavidus sp. UYMSc13B]
MNRRTRSPRTWPPKIRLTLNSMPASRSACASRLCTWRTASPTMEAASNMSRAVHSECFSSWFSARIWRTDWLIARLPAVISTITRSPGSSNTVILRDVEMASTPALVRESDRNTRPVSSRMATQ